MGSQLVLRSMDQGAHFEPISGDLTQGGRPGDVPYGTLTSIDESPLVFGLLYCGSDDGLVHISRDGGFSWRRITDGLPTDLWVSRIQASRFHEGRVYVSLNGYRWDHFDAYVFRSEDYGHTWTRIATDLPGEPVNVIREDPVNEDLLYIGTDHGVYLALHDGRTVMPFDRDLPRVPVHDLVIQEPTSTLVLGTHGRSFFKADVSLVQKLKPELTNQELVLLPPDPVRFQSNWGKKGNAWREPTKPEIPIWTFSTEPRKLNWSIYPQNEGKMLLAHGEVEVGQGLSAWIFDGVITEEKGKIRWLQKQLKEGEVIHAPNANEPHYLIPGKYRILMENDQINTETILEIVEKKRGN
ncbi:MAG: hypothetical protein IPJ06_13375 [Saprospiraceae bacterium]|nr:hypothetical protein [Saprospiraceae bacterium]